MHFKLICLTKKTVGCGKFISNTHNFFSKQYSMHFRLNSILLFNITYKICIRNFFSLLWITFAWKFVTSNTESIFFLSSFCLYVFCRTVLLLCARVPYWKKNNNIDANAAFSNDLFDVLAAMLCGIPCRNVWARLR